MDSLSVVVAATTGSMGLLFGALWQRRCAARAPRAEAAALASLRCALDAQRSDFRRSEAELIAQRQHCFALEGELEARENDWARISQALVAFDVQTFEVECASCPDSARPLRIPNDARARSDSWQEQASR